MGEMRFQVHLPDKLTAEAAERAYFFGPDRAVFQSRGVLDGEEFILERFESDSGFLAIPYQVEGRGELVVGSAWLMERDRPYHLEIELARGKINQVRNQLYEWQAIGLSSPPKLKATLREASKRFAAAVTAQIDPREAAQHADGALAVAFQAAELLTAAFAEQAIAARMRNNSRLDTALAVNLGDAALSAETAAALIPTISAANVPMRWRAIQASEQDFTWEATDKQFEFCAQYGLPVFGGPLVAFAEDWVPDWLYLFEGDSDNLLPTIEEFIEAAVKRYRGKVHAWCCAAHVNIGDVLDLSAEDRLRLVVRSVEIVHKFDPGRPMLLGFDQPWGEYMADAPHDPPLYLADMLIRAGLGLSGIALNLDLGYHPGGCGVRDPLDISQLLDAWALFGLPLYVFLRLPGGQTTSGQPPNRPIPGAVPGGWRPAAQKYFIDRILPMLLGKPNVRGVIWNQLRDAEARRFPCSGLLDLQDKPRGGLSSLTGLKRAYLK